MTDSVIIKIVNLTDTERRIAYNYEMQMSTGHLVPLYLPLSEFVNTGGTI